MEEAPCNNLLTSALFFMNNFKYKKEILISVIIPCYNEEEVLPETIRRLDATKAILQEELATECNFLHENSKESNTSIKKFLSFEFIFVNDGSRDKTSDILITLSQQRHYVRVINFARNFGHQIAVTAGIDASNGDAVVLIDADLQDPPELIAQMVKLWLQGNDVVYATRIKRRGETVFKRLTAKLFYRIINMLSDTSIPPDTGDFRLMDRKVVDTIRAMKEHDRFIRGMVSWVGFKQISLPYERAERFAGKSKYPLIKMISFALTGILSFSLKPLKIASLLGIICSSISFLGFLYALFVKLFTNHTVTGWTSLILAILFIGGIQLFCIGVLGEYIGRIYTDSKDRPLYIVEGYYGYRANNDEPKISRSPVREVN